jgi:GNAT superfamily N-acetyltransferase
VDRRVVPPEYRVEPLGASHDRAGFSCGVAELDRYIQQQAGQDLKRKLAAVFVLTADSREIAGFYTLSASSILAAALPPDLANRLPRFPLPVTLLGRMGVVRSKQGFGFGQFLLFHALERAWRGSHEIGCWAVIVDAKAGARDFYLKHSFRPFPAEPDRLFLLMNEIEKMFRI